MTFSLIGRCERTGMFGIAISSVQAMPWGIALVKDTNAWICPGYSR